MTVAIAALTSVRQPYPSYKATDVPWSDVVPDHWDVQSVKYGFDVRLGKMLQNEPITPSDTLVPYLRSVNVGWDGIDTSNVKEMWFSPSDKMLYRLAPGDLVVCEGGDVGRCSIWRDQIAECYIQNAVHRVRSRSGYSNGFLYYWLSLLKGAGYIDLVCNKATIAHLTVEKLRALPLFCPPQVEQHAITAFLDRETAKSDALIAKKERLIDVLREKRAAAIAQAVFRGLHPNQSMEYSGIDWLGNIPNHWSVKRIKHVISGGLVNGLFKTKDQFGSGTNLINVSDIYRDTFRVDNDGLDRVEATDQEIGTYRVQQGDIFFVRSSLKLEGVAASACVGDVPEAMVFECHLIRVRPSPKYIAPGFLIYYLNSTPVRQRLVSLAETTTMTTISQPKLAALEVCVPPLVEQNAIVDRLHRETSTIDALIDKVREHIDTLHEHRAALISAAVTGKIDVREDSPQW